MTWGQNGKRLFENVMKFSSHFEEYMNLTLLLERFMLHKIGRLSTLLIKNLKNEIFSISEQCFDILLATSNSTQ